MKPSHEDEIEDGNITTFKQYVTLIIDDLRQEIETSTPPQHYEQQAEIIDEKIKKLEAADASALYDEVMKDRTDRIKYLKDKIVRQNFRGEIVKSILKEIEEWKCDDCVRNLKNDWIEDFEIMAETLDSESDEKYLMSIKQLPIPKDGEQIRTERIESLKKTKDSYKEYHARDLERYEQRQKTRLIRLENLEKI